MLELARRLGRRDRPAHGKQLHDAEREQPVHHHRQERRPFKDAARDCGRTEDCGERKRERVREPVDERGESRVRIRAKQPQQEPEHKQHLKDAEDIPDDLGAAVERLGG